jgi:flagellar capping protein FliD
VSEFVGQLAETRSDVSPIISSTKVTIGKEFGDKRFIELDITIEGNPQSVPDVVNFLTELLGVDLVAQRDELKADIKYLNKELEEINNRIKGQQTDLDNAKERLERVRKWFAEHGLNDQFFDDIPF